MSLQIGERDGIRRGRKSDYNMLGLSPLTSLNEIEKLDINTEMFIYA